jgi:hypothetical protein
MASFKKRFKKIVRTIHKYEGRVLKVAAPIVGAAFLGPVGAAAGTALGTAASYYGEKQGALASGKHGAAVRKAGRRGLKSGLIIGGIVTGGAVALSIAGGAGAATGAVSTLGKVFGSSPKPKGAADNPYGIVTEQDLATSLQTQSQTNSNPYGIVTQNDLNNSLGGGQPGASGGSGFPWSALTNSSRSIGATGQVTGDRDFGQLGALFRSQGTGLAAIPPIVWIGGAAALILAI